MKWSIRAARRTLPYSASRWDIRIREKSIEGHVLRNIWHFSLARVPRKEVILAAKIYLGKDINFFMASQTNLNSLCHFHSSKKTVEVGFLDQFIPFESFL